MKNSTKFKVVFCVCGVITAPWGVPTVVLDHCPCSDTPALTIYRSAEEFGDLRYGDPKTSLTIYGQWCQTITQLDTPLNYPHEGNLKEVEVVDPAHPLYGRRFPLVSVSSPSCGDRHATVAYQKGIQLRIPVSATNLFPTIEPLAGAKISLDAVAELVELAGELGISCQAGGAR